MLLSKRYQVFRGTKAADKTVLYIVEVPGSLPLESHLSLKIVEGDTSAVGAFQLESQSFIFHCKLT